MAAVNSEQTASSAPSDANGDEATTKEPAVVTPQFSLNTFWDEVYGKEAASFDWLQRYGVKGKVAGSTSADSSALAKAIREKCGITHESKVLVVGCGTSRLSEELLADLGPALINNIDFSAAVIPIMKDRHKGNNKLRWAVANMLDMKQLFADDGVFDFVVDKAAIDCVFCGQNSTANVRTAVAEIHRILKPGGKYIIVSWGAPEERLPFIQTTYVSRNKIANPHRAETPLESAAAVVRAKRPSAIRQALWQGGTETVALEKPRVTSTILDASHGTGQEHYMYILTKKPL